MCRAHPEVTSPCSVNLIINHSILDFKLVLADCILGPGKGESIFMLHLVTPRPGRNHCSVRHAVMCQKHSMSYMYILYTIHSHAVQAL